MQKCNYFIILTYRRIRAQPTAMESGTSNRIVLGFYKFYQDVVSNELFS